MLYKACLSAQVSLALEFKQLGRVQFLMRKNITRIAVILVVCLIALVIVVTLSLGSIVKRGVEKVGPQVTKTDVTLGGANLSVLSGSGTLKEFVVGNPQGYSTPHAFKVGEVAVGVKPRSVFADKIHVTHVKVLAPEITFEGALGQANNLSKILENVKAVDQQTEKGPVPDPKAQGPARKFQVDDFLISGATVNVNINMLGAKPMTVTIPDIHFANLGTGPDGITAAELTKKILDEVTALVMKAVEKDLANITKSATDLLSKSATNILSNPNSNTLDKAGKSIGDLFKKK
jgi:hypothetical protein